MVGVQGRAHTASSETCGGGTSNPNFYARARRASLPDSRIRWLDDRDRHIEAVMLGIRLRSGLAVGVLTLRA